MQKKVEEIKKKVYNKVMENENFFEKKKEHPDPFVGTFHRMSDFTKALEEATEVCLTNTANIGPHKEGGVVRCGTGSDGQFYVLHETRDHEIKFIKIVSSLAEANALAQTLTK